MSPDVRVECSISFSVKCERRHSPCQQHHEPVFREVSHVILANRKYYCLNLCATKDMLCYFVWVMDFNCKGSAKTFVVDAER